MAAKTLKAPNPSRPCRAPKEESTNHLKPALPQSAKVVLVVFDPVHSREDLVQEFRPIYRPSIHRIKSRRGQLSLFLSSPAKPRMNFHSYVDAVESDMWATSHASPRLFPGLPIVEDRTKPKMPAYKADS